MKKTIAVLISILLLGCLTVQAQDDEKQKKRYDVEKKKIYEKSYSLSAGDKVKINNQFGFVKINTWDKNEVKVFVEMIASAKSESRANDILEELTVTDKKNGNVISFKTSIDGNKGNNYNNNSVTMEINYTVHLPSSTMLDLKNDFGAITMPDYNGNLDVTSKFGSLTTGKLANVEEVLVEFGKANIQSISNGTATFKFSKAEVGNLVGTNTLKFEFCNKSKVVLDNSATHTTINESYSTLNIKPAADFNASFDIRTSFGSFRNRTGFKFSRTDEEPEYGSDSNKEYEGACGTGNNKVKIKSSFGTIILGEAKAGEMKDDDNDNDDEPKKKKKKTNDDDDEEA
jgi:formylmethanofuran dehydrogenase subunit D